jgi:uncharacterized SAM-binding protein YcdF (DUF218 family)
MRVEKLPYILFILTLILTLLLGLIFLSLLHKVKGGARLKKIKFFYQAVFVTFILSFLSFQGMVLHYMERPLPNMKYDYLIVLGTGNRSNTTKKRVNKALSYASKHHEIKIITSGGRGKGEKVSEAKAMSQLLKAGGINSNRIFLEENSRNTFENIKFSKEILKTLEGENFATKKIVIVSSDFHIFRSLVIAQGFGLNAFGLPSQSSFYFKLNAMVREYFAFIKDCLLLSLLNVKKFLNKE